MSNNRKKQKIIPNAYVYETSPKKLNPEYIPPKQKNNKKEIKQEILIRKQKRRKQHKLIWYITFTFAILFGMGFQNSKINEQFSELKASEKQLLSIQKENEQLRVNIENSLNLANLENMAKEQLGMQKASKEQTRYVRLPKKDYVELASEQIVLNTDQNIIDKIIKFIEGIVR